jgi:hypothetical protein
MPGGVPNPANGSAGRPAPTHPTGGWSEDSRGYTAFAMVMLVIGELGFVLATTLWVELTIAQALQAAGGATAIGLMAFYGKAMLLTVGRRILGNSS